MIRPMEASDIPSVHRLQEHLTYFDPGIVEAAVRGPFCGRVAVEDGSVAGYAIAFPGDPATLSELVVEPGYRRQGYGRALVSNVTLAVESSVIAVLTSVENEDAKRFYTAMGFGLDGRKHEFYADGTDALRLVLGE